MTNDKRTLSLCRLCPPTHRLDGVVNGINLIEWNPAADPAIAAPYSQADMSGKAAGIDSVKLDPSLKATCFQGLPSLESDLLSTFEPENA